MFWEFLQSIWPVCAFSVLLMLGIWWLALKLGNLGIVDIAWSAAFAPVAFFYAATGRGTPLRRWQIAAMAGFWSLRLGAHLYFRVAGHHPAEDVRYAKLRLNWGEDLKKQALIFFELQAALIIVLSFPFYLISQNTTSGNTPLEIAGMVIWLIAVGGESVADWQLKQFRGNPANKGKICQQGLWCYSRHPNYFFEWLVWVSFFVFALGAPWGWTSVFCPALMLFFLLRVTGIPMTEELSVRSKGEAYRQYQRTTSPFVPWFKTAAK